MQNSADAAAPPPLPSSCWTAATPSIQCHQEHQATFHTYLQRSCRSQVRCEMSTRFQASCVLPSTYPTILCRDVPRQSLRTVAKIRPSCESIKRQKKTRGILDKAAIQASFRDGASLAQLPHPTAKGLRKETSSVTVTLTKNLNTYLLGPLPIFPPSFVCLVGTRDS
jgi:hypothetical protein